MNSDGRCSIRIINVIGSQVTLWTTIDAGKPVEQRAEVGSRVTVDAGDIVYYIDLHRVRGNIVDLSVHWSKK